MLHKCLKRRRDCNYAGIGSGPRLVLSLGLPDRSELPLCEVDTFGNLRLGAPCIPHRRKKKEARLGFASMGDSAE